MLILMLMHKFLSGRLNYSQACAELEMLKQREPNFTDSNIQSPYLLSHDEDHRIVIMDFEISKRKKCLKQGYPVMPIWLDEIHSLLTEKLDQVSYKTDPERKRQKAEQMECEVTTRKNRIDQILLALRWNILLILIVFNYLVMRLVSRIYLRTQVKI